MIADELRDILDRELFQPSRVRLSIGDAYDVRNPGLALVMRSRLFLAFPNSDRWTLIPFLHIAAIESPADGDTRRRLRHKRGE